MLFASKLAHEVQRGPGTEVNFAKIATFGWDRVFIFSPYTPPKQIEEKFGFSWRGASSSGIEMNEGEHLIVFTSAKRVTASVMLRRNKADFADEAYKHAWSREDARFIVTTNSEGWVVLFPF